VQGEGKSVISAHGVVPDRCRFPVRWSEKFAVVALPAGKSSLTAPGLAAELCAFLEAGAAGLVVPDARARRVIRLVALDEVMPVYASVNGALAAAVREAARPAAGGD
jgi:hypothetical protein